MTARIVVLGADGFIGRRMLAALAESGWATPVAGVRRPGTSPAGIERVAVDATDPASLKSALAGAQGVINCVAGSAAAIVANARALAEAAPGAALVYLSSMAVYGSATGRIDETAPLAGDTGPYAAAKVAAERVLAAHGRAVLLRPGIVYGPGSTQWSGRIARWLQSGRIGDLGAAGDGICNLVHVDEVAAAALAALRSPPASATAMAFNLGSQDPPTWNEYFLHYARALGAVPLRRIPRWQLKLETRLLAVPLKILELVAGKAGLRGLPLPPPIPPSLLGTFAQEIQLDVSRARAQLGLSGRPLDEGLAQTAASYRPHV